MRRAFALFLSGVLLCPTSGAAANLGRARTGFSPGLPGAMAGGAALAAQRGQLLAALQVQLGGILKAPGGASPIRLGETPAQNPAVLDGAKVLLVEAALRPEFRARLGQALAALPADGDPSQEALVPARLRDSVLARFSAWSELLEAEGLPARERDGLLALRARLSGGAEAAAIEPLSASLGRIFENSQLDLASLPNPPVSVQDGRGSSPASPLYTLSREAGEGWGEGPRGQLPPHPSPLPPSGGEGIIKKEPGSGELLARAAAAGIGLGEIGNALKAAPDLASALSALIERGVIREGEFQSPPGERLVYALTGLWRAAVPHIRPQFSVDASFPVPAIVVERAGIRYFIHGVPHRMFGIPVPVRGAEIRRLVKRLRDSGATLFSEQGFARHYGYAYGKEMLDHAALDGVPVGVRDLSRNLRAAFAAAFRALGRSVILPLMILLPAAAFVHDPGGVAVWLAVTLWPAALMFGTAFTPFYRLYYRSLAARALAEDKDPDKANFHERLGAVYYGRRLDLNGFLETVLPMPLQTDVDAFVLGAPNSSVRSWGMARAIQRAGAPGSKPVHLLVGINHAPELAWVLAEGADAR